MVLCLHFGCSRMRDTMGFWAINQTTTVRLKQLMSRFLEDNLANSFQFPSEFSEDFRNVCSNDLGCRDVGSVAATLSNNDETFTSACSRGIFDDMDLYLLSSIIY